MRPYGLFYTTNKQGDPINYNNTKNIIKTYPVQSVTGKTELHYLKKKILENQFKSYFHETSECLMDKVYMHPHF
jgi:hypothetical protein